MAGHELTAGQGLVAPNGHYQLIMQGDGNLVLYWRGFHPIWASNTGGHPGAFLAMQTDGNLVIYAKGRALWATGTDGHPAAAYFLAMQSDGNVVIYTPTERPLFATNTAVRGVRIAPSTTPAFSGDAADPDVIQSGGTFYAFTTGTALGNHLQALIDTTGNPTSGWRSFTGQSFGSSALPNTPGWQTVNTQTSPGVAFYDHHWVMFYDAAVKPFAGDTGHNCLSVATAPTLTPSHPVFTDRSTGPLFCSPGGVLDPSPFVNPATGKAFVVWKSNDGSSPEASQIFIARLSSTGTSFASAPTPLLTVDQPLLPWETTVDDPQMVLANGAYRILFSRGTFSPRATLRP